MPNPFEPAKSSPLTATPLHHYPEFLPPSSFGSSDWPTWASIEPSIQTLIANTSTNTNSKSSHTNANTNAHPHLTPSYMQTTSHRRPTITDSVTAQRKRRTSKSEGQGEEEQMRLLGEGFGVGEVLEALRAKVEVDRVVGRLLEWRRVNQSVGMGKQKGTEEEVDGEGDGTVDAK